MADLLVACVWTGTRYPLDYVSKLRSMVARHLKRPHTMVCLTDQAGRCDGVSFIDISQMRLPGRWAKMLLFEPGWREGHKIVYFDLATVILDDIAPLADVPGEFAIRSRNSASVMVIGAGMAGFVWSRFDLDAEGMMAEHKTERRCIEVISPGAPTLQRLLPKGFFYDQKHLTPIRPNAAVVSFTGQSTPYACPFRWVQEAWQ